MTKGGVDSPMSEAELRLVCSGPLSQAFRYCFMVKPGIDIELILMLEWSQSRLFAAHAQRVYSPMLGRLFEPAAFCSGSGGGGGVDVALFSRLMWSSTTGEEEGGGGGSVGMTVSDGQCRSDDGLMLRSRGWTHCCRTWTRLSSRCERRPAADEDDDASS
jgi:hypothetical protein